MAPLLISMGIGGSLGTIIGILKDPLLGITFKFATKNLLRISKGEHLNAEEKGFIKKYNSRQLIHEGVNYTDQYKMMSLSIGR